MTVTECKIKKADAGLSLDGVRQSGYVRLVYSITSDDFSQMPLSIFQQAWVTGPDPLPQRYDGYNIRGETDNAIFCQSTELSRIHTSSDAPTGKWECNVTFAPPPVGTTAAQMTPNPFLRPPVTWIETEVETIYLHEAYCEQDIPSPAGGGNFVDSGDFVPITNAALDPIEAFLQTTESSIIVATERAWPSLLSMANQILTMQNTLNADAFLGRNPKHCKWLSLSCSPQTDENGILYYTGIERVLLSNAPIVTEILNQGWRYFKSGTLQKVRELQNPNQFLLDINGEKLADGTPGNTIAWRPETLVDYTTKVLVA